MDLLDAILAVGGTFDWITPMAELLMGDEHAFASHDYDACERKARELSGQGMKAGVKSNGVNGWIVVVKR